MGAVSRPLAPLVRRTAMGPVWTPVATTTTVGNVAMSARVVQPVKVALASVKEVLHFVAATAVRLVNHAFVGVVVIKWAQPVVARILPVALGNPAVVAPVSMIRPTTTTVGDAAMPVRPVKLARKEFASVMQAPAPMAVVTRMAHASRERCAASVGRGAARV
jgi:hypothetical protein